MRVAVIISAYNRPDSLAAVLDGFSSQTEQEFELIVGDDGSGDEVKRVVEEYSKHSRFRVLHLWQENRGFGASVMRNRGIAATQADYVIFVDHDCIPARDFVSQHRLLAEVGYFLSGNRVLLSEEFTARALAEQLALHEWRTGQWFGAWIRRDINRWLPLVRLPDGAFRKRTPERWEGVKTCNFSAWRKDLIAVNGFDEAYAGKWGLEDSDITIRLLHAGIRHKSARFAAPVFHLWHREADKRGFDENQRLLNDLIASKRTRAAVGVDRHL